ncbi:ALQxL family class IV lanthipeptide [Streptosporangium sp. NPDC001559]
MELDITALDLLPAEESSLQLCEISCSITCHGRTCMVTSA